MADKAQIIVRIKRGLLLSEETKKKLLTEVELLNDEQLASLEELLNKDVEVIKRIVDRIMKKKLKDGNAAEFIKEMKEITKKSKSSAGKIAEKSDHEKDLSEAEKLINDM